MDWLLLFIAGLFEIGWAMGLKASAGLTKLWPSVFTLVALTISMALLAISLRTIPVGTGYAVWTGIGAVGTAMLGILLLGEPASAPRLFFLSLIVVGLLGLKAVS